MAVTSTRIGCSGFLQSAAIAGDAITDENPVLEHNQLCWIE
jgi:hypothetical protein